MHRPYRLVRNSVVVVVLVTSVSLTVFVKVLLSRVGKAGTVILKKEQNVDGSFWNSASECQTFAPFTFLQW